MSNNIQVVIRPLVEQKPIKVMATVPGVTTLELQNSMTTKVDKVEGKGLSTNDYSNEEKLKLTTVKAELESHKEDYATQVDRLDGRIDVIITTPAEGISVQEIVDARQGELSIGANLTGVKEQLSDSNAEIIENKFNMNRELISRRNRKPMITIIDDDGKTNLLTTWEPILQEKYCKLDIAVLVGSVGNSGYLPWNELERLKDSYNVDLVNHSFYHYSMALETEIVVRDDFEKSVSELKARGHSYDVMVYPGGSQNAMVRKVTREYCRAGIYTGGGINTPPLDSYFMNRVSLMPASGEMESLETYTAYIDEAITNNGWIIFMAHSQFPSFDSVKVKALIDYANANNIEWVNTVEGLDKMGNLIDIGDYTARATSAEYTIIDCDGILHSFSNLSVPKITPVDAYNINSIPTDFEIRRISITPISEQGKTGFPKNSSGILITNNITGASYPYQEYHCILTGKTFKRTWNNVLSAWTTFKEYAAVTNFTKTITGTIPPNGTLDVTVNSILATTDILVGVPSGLLESGIMYCIMINAANSARIRFLNTTNTEIVLASRVWNFTLITG